MPSVNIQLQGFTPANRDAQVTLTEVATGSAITRPTFLDGSLMVRDLNPGLYDLKVTHPNLINPIETRRIRIFPQIPPTFIPIPVPDVLFQDTPIAQLPLANLGPVQNTLSSTKSSLDPIGNKSPGEAIRAADWNRLVGAVSDMAGAVLELTNLVSPRGHAHPEIADKIAEVQSNLRNFTEAFGRSLIELRREIEIEFIRRQFNDVLVAGGAGNDVLTRVNARVAELVEASQGDTPTFTQKLTNLGSVALTEVNALAAQKGEEFRNQPATKQLMTVAQTYFEAGTQLAPEAEIQTYQRTTTVTAGTKFATSAGVKGLV